MQTEIFQYSFRRLWRPTGLILATFALSACGNDNSSIATAPATAPIPDPPSFTAKAAAVLLKLGQLNGVEPTAAGAGVEVVAAAELQPKADDGRIQLHNADGSPIARSDIVGYLAIHDFGRFGDGSVIAHILAGQSAGQPVDIAGISLGADAPDYDALVSFLQVQKAATRALDYVTGLSVSPQTGALRQLSGAFGDALHTTLAGRRYIALDSLNSPFAYSASDLLRRTHQPITSSIEALGQRRQRIGPAGSSTWTVQTKYLLNDPSRAAISWQTEGVALSVSQNVSPGLLSGVAAQSLLSAAPHQSDSALYAPWASRNYNWQTAGTRVALGPTQVSLTQFVGRTRPSEQNEHIYSAPKQAGHIARVASQLGRTRLGTQLLDSNGTDELLGLSIGDTQLQALNVWAVRPLSRNGNLIWSLWQLNAEADRGTGLLEGARNLRGDAWILGYGTHRWMLRLEQPLRIRSGELYLRLPTAHAADRTASFDRFSLNPAPSGREMRLQTDFAIPLRFGKLQLSTGMAQQPDHISEADYSPYALMTLRLHLN